MIDIKLIREDPDLVKENVRKKFQDDKLKLVDLLVKKDEMWRKVKYDADKLRGERNKVSEEINKAKKAKDEKKAKELIKKAKEIPDKIKKLEEKTAGLIEEIRGLQIEIPNIMSKNVPIGEDEKGNKVARKVGKIGKFGFPVKSHVELIDDLGLGDFESSSRVSGTGFYYLEGELALLNQALLNYARDIMVKKGFKYVETPLLLREEIIDKVTDLNDKEQQIYVVDDDPKMALIGTSEHSLIGRFVDSEIEGSKLPIKHTSYSMCFRKEIGAHGIDERGLFRTHQFNKIEMIVICDPSESEGFFKEMQDISVEIFEGLEVPIRVLKICSGDLGDLKYEQIDVEAYSPRRKDYFEVGSCSNLTGSQARKLGITSRVKGDRITPHTLNNTALASSRALVAILENHQQKDGSVKIPKVLWKYTGFRVIKGDGGKKK
ncbi:serine--tRNA ligase [Candidatus Pacearchaeota archaeon]|jgi:seryl-tRNA synthetase|nr:serine--tRNA ligase [Candidatus Pacearchaeota archaeon]|tara:strand:+ start:4133 stop:5431 length:1299 start_codon:yes stop_codon:yes gene_type:complete